MCGPESANFRFLDQMAGLSIEKSGDGSVLIFIVLADETASELRAGLDRWINYHNNAKPHSAHGGNTNDEAYGRAQQDIRLAA